MKKNKNKNYSKKLCTFSIIQFCVVLFLSLVCSFLGVGMELFPYLIPASAAIATASLSFYFTKAKSENLSKQKIRNVVLKLALEEKLQGKDYYEIIEEVENIDITVQEKLNSLYEDSINEDSNNEVI